MIELSDVTHLKPSAIGRNIITRERMCQVEKEDVGIRPDYLGYQQPGKQINESDVIVIYYYEGFTCWCFVSKGGQNAQEEKETDGLPASDKTTTDSY